MIDAVPKLFERNRRSSPLTATPLVLINGLAEQSESWFANRAYWSRRFDVKVPELLVYNGPVIHEQIRRGGEISVEFLANRLGQFLDQFVQRPPYNLVGSSLGGQIILTYAAREPEKVDRIVLLAPSGFGGEERLPVIEGVRRSDSRGLIRSVFCHERFVTDTLVAAIEGKFQDRLWKRGVLHTLRGTLKHSVTDLLDLIAAQCLIVWGTEDRVIADVPGSIRAADRILRCRQVVIPKCGHAPQIEKPRLINRLVHRFLVDKLKDLPPALDPNRYLRESAMRPRQEEGEGPLDPPLSSPSTPLTPGRVREDADRG